MKQEIRSKIIDVFYKNSGYARTKEIIGIGIHNIYLKELEEDGTIIKIKQGLYSLSENKSFNSLYESLITVPGGIICLGSALSYYDLTTWDPVDIHVAILHGRKIVLPEYPPIQLYHFTGNFFEIGKTFVTLSTGHKIPIYDKEKTICDLIRYRNRIGIDIMKEALIEYMKLKEKNLNQLFYYAKILKISTVLNQYMEVLL